MFSQAFDLATMQHCVDQWNAQWPESDCSTQRNVICLAWWLLVPLIINERAPLLTFKVLLTLRSAVMLYLVKQTWWSLFGLFACRILSVMFWLAEYYLWCSDWLNIICDVLIGWILSVTFWLAEGAQVIGSPDPSVQVLGKLRSAGDGHF